MTPEIQNVIHNLKLELYKIQCRNWIPSLSKGKGAAGETLELLLKKDKDRNVLPDYGGIELKTRSKFSDYPLHLFSCAFDNKPLEMQRLLRIGGYPDNNNPNFRVFQIRVNAVERKNVRKYSYILNVNRIKQVVELLVFIRNTDVQYTSMSWSFRELKSRLEHKVSYMALVGVLRERVEEKTYFKYSDINFYQLKSFEQFLDLIENGTVTVSFNLTYYHSGERYGKYLDKGTGFNIDYLQLELLFNKIKDLGDA